MNVELQPRRNGWQVEVSGYYMYPDKKPHPDGERSHRKCVRYVVEYKGVKVSDAEKQHLGDIIEKAASEVRDYLTEYAANWDTIILETE